MSPIKNHFGDSSQIHFTTKNNTRVTAQKGGLAILPCVVKLNSPATVSWIRRSDFQLLTVGLSTHSSDKRFLVEHTRHMGHWSLRIKSVRESDRGLYECQLSIHPTESIFIELKVVEAVAEIVGAPDLHIDEGSSMRLECRLRKATENPAFVFWYHNNKMVNYDTQQGFSVTTAIVVSTTPKEEPHSFFNNSINTVARKPKESKDIIYNTNKSVLPATKLQLSPYILAPTSSILTLEIVRFQHAGNYTCAPSNARPVSINVHVLRGENPAAMQQSNHSSTESDSNNSSISGPKLSYSGASSIRTIFVLTTSAIKVKIYYSLILEYKISLLVRVFKSIILLLLGL
ncbi:limbic system-associated membrane protein isoform X2 [Eurosta solidaginis]